MSQPPTGTATPNIQLMAFARDCWLKATGTSTEEAIWAWQVATGEKTGNPQNQATQRNQVVRQKNGLFEKTYSDGNYQQLFAENERFILLELANERHKNQRQHVNALADARIKGSSFDHSIVTKDVGTNLNIWASWCPLTWVAGVPVPLFAHPVWLAALTHRTLLILQRLAEVGITHTDIWDANLCLADWLDGGLFKGSRPNQRVLRSQVSLTQLSLRAIDFETAFCSSQPGKYVPVVRNDTNSWASPRLQEITAKTPHEQTLDADAQMVARRQRIAQQLDGRVDLWALGDALRGWLRNAQLFWQHIHVQDIAGHPQAQRLMPAFECIKTNLLRLTNTATALEAHAPDNFTPGEQWTTNSPLPHQGLRKTLEQAFPVLAPMDGAPSQASIWPLWMLNPTKDPMGPWQKVHEKLSQQVRTQLASHRKPLTTIAAGVVLGAGVGWAGWQYQTPLMQTLASSQTWAASTAQTWAEARLDAQRQYGTWWADQSTQLALGLLATVGGNATTRDQAIVNSLANQPAVDPRNGLVHLKTLPAAELLQARDEAARGAQQLASLSAAELKRQAHTCQRAPGNVCLLNAQVTRLYHTQLALGWQYHDGNAPASQRQQLDDWAGGGVLTTHRLNMPTLLNSLNTLAQAPQPLARLLWVQYAACQTDASTLNALPTALNDLAAELPGITNSFIQPYRLALAANRNPCEAAATSN